LGEFPKDLADRLRSATNLPAYDLFCLESEFSNFIGKCCRRYIENAKFSVDFIASHGHTVFHYPDKGFTTQIGNGGSISQIAQCDVIADFRSSDIGAEGQGAPFAPIADHYLFTDVEIMLNIGGISNISIKTKDNITAFDVSPANQLLNFLAGKFGQAFDNEGVLASKGEINDHLLRSLISTNQLVDTSPRAIDNSWVSDNFFPLLEKVDPSSAMRTCVEFITHEVLRAIEFTSSRKSNSKSMMVTGGGALNTFLMSELRNALSEKGIRIQEIREELVKFKEAIMIALMGYLRLNKNANAFKSYTGALRNTIGGAVYVY